MNFTAVSGLVKGAGFWSWSSHSETLRDRRGNGRANIVLVYKAFAHKIFKYIIILNLKGAMNTLEAMSNKLILKSRKYNFNGEK